MDGFESSLDELYEDTIMDKMTLKEEIMLPSSKVYNFYKVNFKAVIVNTYYSTNSLYYL